MSRHDFTPWMGSLAAWLLAVSLGGQALGQSDPENPSPIRVACVGDSITAGARVDAKTESYPSRLQELLGGDYQVTNFGLGGATLIKTGRPNVWQKLKAVLEFQPHVVVVSLGTNDTVGDNRKNWEQIDRFDDDYVALIDQFKGLSTRPSIVLCTPTSMVLQTSGLSADRLANLTQRQPRLQQLCQQVRELAADHAGKNVSLLELNAVLRDRTDLVTAGDGVHPNREGYLAIAKAVATHIRELDVDANRSKRPSEKPTASSTAGDR